MESEKRIGGQMGMVGDREIAEGAARDEEGKRGERRGETEMSNEAAEMKQTRSQREGAGSANQDRKCRKPHASSLAMLNRARPTKNNGRGTRKTRPPAHVQRTANKPGSRMGRRRARV